MTAVPDLVVELPDGDVGPLLEHLAGATYVNLHPGVDPDEAPPPPTGGVFGGILSNRGPVVPLATWTPGEIGIQHMAGSRFARFLADKGVPVPDEWYVAADHPRRGLVVRTYDAPDEEVLRWLVRAATAACPIEIDRPWQAVVHLG